MSDEQKIEDQIQAKGLNAPRLTPQHIDDSVHSEQYYVFPGTSMTVCLLVLKNGFKVVGSAAPVSDENLDEGLGRQIAKRNAREQIWILEGYLLKQRLCEGASLSRNNHRLGEGS